MKIDVLSLFPAMINQALEFSIPARAQKNNQVAVNAHNLRDWAIDKRGTVDDSPYGGGPGMILRVDVAHAALEAIDHGHKAHRIMLSPDGDQLTQSLVTKLSEKKHLILLCGRYEGFDARIEKLIDQKLSVGPYVVSGGELPALVAIDAIIRLLPGVLGNEASLTEETFEQNATEYPQYTRPETYQGTKVPDVLLSGHHQQIIDWRNDQRRSLS